MRANGAIRLGRLLYLQNCQIFGSFNTTHSFHRSKIIRGLSASEDLSRMIQPTPVPKGGGFVSSDLLSALRRGRYRSLLEQAVEIDSAIH